MCRGGYTSRHRQKLFKDNLKNELQTDFNWLSSCCWTALTNHTWDESRWGVVNGMDVCLFCFCPRHWSNSQNHHLQECTQALKTAADVSWRENAIVGKPFRFMGTFDGVWLHGVVMDVNVMLTGNSETRHHECMMGSDRRWMDGHENDRCWTTSAALTVASNRRAALALFCWWNDGYEFDGCVQR